jgi:Crp-like helix-turn-helix domain
MSDAVFDAAAAPATQDPQRPIVARLSMRRSMSERCGWRTQNGCALRADDGLWSLRPDGVAQEGRYANSIKTLTPVTAYRIPIEALQSRLLSDAALGFHVITKLCQELLQAQRHAFLLANKRTVPQLVMFLQMLEQLQAAKGDPNNEIHIPMDRSDIAHYLGISLAALSRAFRTLTTRGILQSRDRRHVKVMDRGAFDMLAYNIK